MKLIMEGWRDWIGLGKEEPEPEAALEPEEDEEDEEDLSQEAKLAMLALHEDEANRDQALMMFEMLADGLDLDLLATERDDRLHTMWEALEPARDAMAVPHKGRAKMSPEHNAAFEELVDWIFKLQQTEKFISGDSINKEVRLSQDVYKLGSMQDMLARALKQTARLWRER